MKRITIMILFAICSVALFPAFAHATEVEFTVTSSDYNPYAGGHTAPVQVFVGNADKPCKEIGMLRTSGGKSVPDQDYIDALKVKAQEIGADAITNIQFDTGTGPWVRVNGVMATVKTRVVRATAVIFTGPVS